MKTFLKYTLYLLLLAFVACSSEEDATPTGSNGQAQPGDALELTVSATDFVTDGAPDTRATDSGTTTTFEDDDRVGVIVLDGTGELLYNNIPYEYNSNSNQWMFDSDNDEGKDGCYYDSEARTYIVYYPYSPAADDVCDVDDLKAIYSPKVNQSTKEDYRASDLMLWSDTPNTPQKSLAVDLKHAYTSVSISPTAKYLLDDGKDTECFTSSLKISDVNFTINNEVYVPYQATDGSLRCILPAGFTTGDIRCFYTVGSKVYSNKISISSITTNNCYTSTLEINHIYSLADARVGDFYCINSNKNGYLIPGDAASFINEQKTVCVGVVYCVDNSFITENSTNKSIGGFTHGLVVALMDANVSDYWGAVSSVSGYKDIVSAPTNSSDWYLPNYDELKYICRGSNYTVSSINGKNTLNGQFVKLGDKATSFGNYDYWANRIINSNGCYVDFENGFASWTYKGDRKRIRSCLAF